MPAPAWSKRQATTARPTRTRTPRCGAGNFTTCSFTRARPRAGRPELRRRRLTDSCVKSPPTRTRPSPCIRGRRSSARAHTSWCQQRPRCQPRMSSLPPCRCRHERTARRVLSTRGSTHAARSDQRRRCDVDHDVEKSGPPSHAIADRLRSRAEVTIHTRRAQVLMSRRTDRLVSSCRQVVSNCRQHSRVDLTLLKPY